MSLEGALAARRFGLGAKPGDIEKASTDPKAWLLDQLSVGDASAHFGGLSPTPDLVAGLLKRRQAQHAKDKDAIKEFVREARQIYTARDGGAFRHRLRHGRTLPRTADRRPFSSASNGRMRQRRNWARNPIR